MRNAANGSEEKFFYSEKSYLNTIEEVMNGVNATPICFNGPSGCGKSFTVKKIKDKLNKEGFLELTFTNDEINKSTYLLKDMAKKIYKLLKQKANIKNVSEIMKIGDIKSVLKSKLASPNANNKLIKTDWADRERDILIRFLKELNIFIASKNIKIFITFDDIEQLEMFQIPKAFKLIKYCKKYLSNAFTFVAANLELILPQFEKGNNDLDLYFNKVLNLTQDITSFKHSNPLVKIFIEKMKIVDINLIKSIDDNIALIQRYIKNNSISMVKNEWIDDFLYEMEFVEWFFYYIENKSPDLYNKILHDIKITLWINSFNDSGNFENRNKQNEKHFKVLNKIIENLKESNYQFTNRNKYQEVLSLILNPENSPVNILIESDHEVMEPFKTPKYLNHYFLMFLYNARLILEKPYNENDKLMIYKINTNDLSKELQVFFDIIWKRILSEDHSAQDRLYFYDVIYNLILFIAEDGIL